MVYITPIATLSPYYYSQPYYGQPYYPQQYYPNYPQSYYNPYNPYPNTNAPCNRATFIADVTVADGTNFAAGASFTKTWRLRNDGTCTWTTGYALVFDHGTAMGGAATVSLPTTVAPGGTVDVSVGLVAPTANGVYQGFWKLQDASANRFGIGYDASVAFWVTIGVGVPYYNYQGSYYNPYPYQNQYQWGYHPPYGYDYNHPYSSGSCLLIAVSPPASTVFGPNSETDIKWTIKNTSSSTWAASAVDYKYIGGVKMYKNSSIYDLPSDVASGSQVDIIVDTIVPSTPGYYTTSWGLDQSGTRLCTMSITLHVK